MLEEPKNTSTPLASSYNDHIRPLLDTIDRLRHLKVMQEGIHLPWIVVVGDQSSGKSSVLESLSGISLPRGQGICTRVPLIMRLQNRPSLSTPELHLEYKDKKVNTTEADIADAINAATKEIAGNGKGICSTPLTLVVRKNGVPDLTMVDLPGITRVPVHGQPEDIYEQISSVIKEYITPQQSIILNVLSASVDFPTCESIRMSQQVDPAGERTLAVVTKADKSPEGLLEKVTVNAVNIGLGYVCVRNRIGDETYKQARAEEDRLFEEHPLLSKIDKSMVGIPVLAQNLMQIQLMSILKCLPSINDEINEKLNQRPVELDRMPESLSSVVEAMGAFFDILISAKECSRNLPKRGENDDYNEELMHEMTRLAEMLLNCAKEQQSKDPASEKKLPKEEISTSLLQRMSKLFSENIIVDFVKKIWAYLEDVVSKVLLKFSDKCHQLKSSIREAAQNIIERMKKRVRQMKLRLAKILSKYVVELRLKRPTSEKEFRVEIINLVEECTGFDLPKFMPKPSFTLLLQLKLKLIYDILVNFFKRVWAYMKDVVAKTFRKLSNIYLGLQSSIIKAAQNIIEWINTMIYQATAMLS